MASVQLVNGSEKHLGGRPTISIQARSNETISWLQKTLPSIQALVRSVTNDQEDLSLNPQP